MIDLSNVGKQTVITIAFVEGKPLAKIEGPIDVMMLAQAGFLLTRMANLQADANMAAMAQQNAAIAAQMQNGRKT